VLVEESSASGLPLLTDTVLFGTGGIMSPSSLKAEFLLPLTISTGNWAMLGLRSGIRGGVLGESFVLTALVSTTDFCLTGNGGGVL